MEATSNFVEVWKSKETTYNIVQVLIANRKVLKMEGTLFSNWFLQGMNFYLHIIVYIKLQGMILYILLNHTSRERDDTCTSPT